MTTNTTESRKKIKLMSTSTPNQSLLDLLMTRRSSSSSDDHPGVDLLDAVLSFLEVGELRALAVTCRTLHQRAMSENQQRPCPVIGSVDRLAALFAPDNHADRVPCRMVHGRRPRRWSQATPATSQQRFLDEDEVLCQAVFQPKSPEQIRCPKHDVPAIFRRGTFDKDYDGKNDKYFLACGKDSNMSEEEEDVSQEKDYNNNKKKQEEQGNDDDDDNIKCDFFQWATSQEQEEAMKNASFVVKFKNKPVLHFKAPNTLLTDMDQVKNCHAYFRRNYQTGYLLMKKIIDAPGNYLVRRRQENRQEREDYWTMDVWENTTTELEGTEQMVSMTRPTVQHASPAAAQAFCDAAITRKKQEGFVERNHDVIQFFLITYDLTPWLNDDDDNNNKVDNTDDTSKTQQPLPPKQILYLGQHDCIDLETIGKFSLSRDGRTMAIWVSMHNYLDYPEDDQRDTGLFKVWIFYQKEQEADGGLLSFCKRPNDIFMGDERDGLDGEYWFEVVVSADGNMIAGYMSQNQVHSSLQVFDTRVGGGAQPLMEINFDPYYRTDMVQYAFCRENRVVVRREKKENVVAEFVGQGRTFPAAIDFTVHYMKNGEEDDIPKKPTTSYDPFVGSDAMGDNHCFFKHAALPEYEQVKRGQTIHDSHPKHVFTYPCRCCGNKFVWTKEVVQESMPRGIHACTSCSWQVQFPHEDEEYSKFKGVF